MKNFIFFTVLICTLFFSCKKESSSLSNKGQKLDSLLVKAENSSNSKFKLKICDSIFEIMNRDKLDSISKKRYMVLARIYQSLNNSKCITICELLISNPSRPSNFSDISYSNFLLGNYYYNVAEYEKSFYHLNIAEKSFRTSRDVEYAGFSIISKANILTFKKDFVGAEKLAIKALKIAKKHNFYLLKYHCYITLGNSSNGLNNYDKAIEYFQKSILECEKFKSDPNYLSYKLQPILYTSNVYINQKEFKKSIEVTKEGLINKNIDRSVYCYLRNSFAYSKFKLGDKTAFNYFIETLKVGDSLNFAPIQITSKTYLGEYYLAQKDTAKANFYLKDAQKQAHVNNIFEDELKLLQLLSKANPDDKSFYSNRYIILNDSLQLVERATRDKFARIEFETDEITTERNSLSEEKKYLTFQILVIVGISILAIIIIILWFKNNSQKAKTRELLLKQDQQKANEEIYQLMMEQQQKIEEAKNIEKQRISLDLHDSVMGKLTAVRLNLYVALIKNNLAEESGFSKQLDEIQEVEKEIRAIAHNLNSDLFSDNANFIGIVKELFAKIENHSQIHFALQVSDAVNWDLVNNATKINLYRILQEALQNIEKYAQATTVAVTMINTDNGELQIEISDDGNGFDVTQKKKGIGLNNMKTRVAELNGKIEIQSAIKKGTKINLIIPI